MTSLLKMAERLKVKQEGGKKIMNELNFFCTGGRLFGVTGLKRGQSGVATAR